MRKPFQKRHGTEMAYQNEPSKHSDAGLDTQYFSGPRRQESAMAPRGERALLYQCAGKVVERVRATLWLVPGKASQKSRSLDLSAEIVPEAATHIADKF